MRVQPKLYGSHTHLDRLHSETNPPNTSTPAITDPMMISISRFSGFILAVSLVLLLLGPLVEPVSALEVDIAPRG
jgi:hypothetical protein